MAALTVEKARRIIQIREGTCIARIVDPASGPCSDQWGLPLTKWAGPEGLEADRVRSEPGSKPGDHTDPLSMVAACPGHHRGTGKTGGVVWSTRKENRALAREYLSRPVVVEKTRILVDTLE